MAKQQRRPGEDRALARTVTSQVKAWSPATRSTDKPIEDVGKRPHYAYMGGYPEKKPPPMENFVRDQE